MKDISHSISARADRGARPKSLAHKIIILVERERERERDGEINCMLCFQRAGEMVVGWWIWNAFGVGGV